MGENMGDNREARTARPRLSLRAKLIRTMISTLGIVATAMLVTVAWMDYRTARRTLGTIETQLKDSIQRKGSGLATNHALALRGLVADNAFSDVGRLVEGAVREDSEMVYGLYLGSDMRPWAQVSPKMPAGAPATGDAWKSLGVDLGVMTSDKPASRPGTLHGQALFEFSAPVLGDEGVVLGRIFYGLSGQMLDRGLASARDDFRRALFTTLGLLGLVGLGAALLGLALITNASVRITRPLAQLTEATTAIAGGRRDVRVSIDSEDEIGSLGRAFNKMVGDLDDYYERLETLNRSLEQRVEERTRELAQRNRDMRLVLDNVSQGFLTMSRTGVLAQERSAILDRWFGPPTGKERFSDYIGRHDRAFADAFDLAYEALVEEILPRELCLEQLPRRFDVQGREFSCSYEPILEGDSPQGLLIVINDITDQLLHARQESEQRELVAMFQGLTRDRSGFLAFFDEASAMVEQLDAPTPETINTQKRLLHTLKGNAGVSGLMVIAEICHRAEDELAEGKVTQLLATLTALRSRWLSLTQALAGFIGDRGREVVEVHVRDLEQLVGDLRSGTASLPRVIARIGSWRLEPVEQSLARLGRHARSLAQRLGKGDLIVEVNAAGIRVAPRRWAPLWSDLVHVIRNAVDHGVDPPDERHRQGKSGPARLRLAASVQGGQFTVEIADDGKGIDWEAVRAAARKRGLPWTTQQDLENALFAPDVSTRSQVTAVSGRGIGLSAVFRRVQELGGRIGVDSRLGHGTRFVLTFPMSGGMAEDTVEGTREERVAPATRLV